MTPLYRHLLRHISATGPLAISEYMHDCLLHPEHGYYSTRDPFGKTGDFVTAPEISQMFGELIGLSLAQSWIDQGAPSDFALAEVGPGRGTLMADILRATRSIPGFHTAANLHLVEASPALRILQQKALEPAKVTWHTEVASLPELPLFLVANEFFDALPIRQFIRDGDAWRERRVFANEDRLTFGLTEATPQPALVSRLVDTKDDDLIEICPAAPAIIAEISTRISTYGGAGLIIDYGDWQSLGDTFQAISNHQFTGPLANPGADDLTAHVDFSALAQAANCAHSKLTDQGLFLQRLGIEARAQALAKQLTGSALSNHINAYQRLTDTDKMGTLFKVLGLFPENAPVPVGLNQ